MAYAEEASERLQEVQTDSSAVASAAVTDTAEPG